MGKNLNLFSRAKFGDKFKTRDGRMVIYQLYDKSHGKHYLFDDRNSFHYAVHDNGHLSNFDEECHCDIIQKWEDTVVEEKLDELVDNCNSNSK